MAEHHICSSVAKHPNYKMLLEYLSHYKLQNEIQQANAYAIY